MFESLWSKLSDSMALLAGTLSAREQEILLAVARTAIPGRQRVAEPDSASIDRFSRQFELYRPAHRAGLRMILWTIEFGPLAHLKRRFSHLSPEDRLAYLESWYHRNLTNRLALRGLLSLLKLAHFDDPAIFEATNCRYAVTPPKPASRPKWKRNIVHLPDLNNDQTVTTDVVIVGTGAGGAVLAKELAEKGVSVVMVEEGLYPDPSQHIGRPPVALNTMYRGGPAVFTIGNTPIWTPSGKTVGGSTAIGFGTCARPPDRVLHHWRHKFGLREFTPENMEPYFERVESILKVGPASREHLGGCARVIRRGCEAMGYTDHGPVQRCVPDCEGYGYCMFGCPSGAKRSTDISYVPLALENKATLFTGARVHTILIENGLARGIEAYVPIRLRRPGVDIKLTVQAKKTVVACGPYVTPALLLRNNLANSSRQVGRNLSLHPGTTVLAEFDETIEGFNAIPQSYQIGEFSDEGLHFAGFFSPPDMISSLYSAIGPEFTRLMESYERLAAFGFTIQDSSRGLVRLGPGGHPLVFYRVNRPDLKVLKRGIEILSEIFFAAGAKYVYPGVHRFDRIRSIRHLEEFRQTRVRAADLTLSAYHPLGTARMAVNPKKSVVSSDHETHDIGKLFIVDGSVLPSSLGVHPQLMIMAMATRAAEKIGRRF